MGSDTDVAQEDAFASAGTSRLSHDKSGADRLNASKTASAAAAAALAAAANVPLPLKQTPGFRASSENPVSPLKTWPVPDSYIVDPDVGTITCICGFNDDDGFTIQCDHCNRWQHAICYGIENIEAAPDDYLCNTCSPRDLDVGKARRIQEHRLRQLYSSEKRGITSTPGKKRKAFQDTNKVHNTSATNTPIQEIDRGATASSSSSNSKGDVKSVKKALNSVFSTAQKEDFAVSPQDAQNATYLLIETYRYNDTYIKSFINRHRDDDWVLSRVSFEKKATEPRQFSDFKNFTSFSKMGLFVRESCQRGDIIDEYLGEIDFLNNYLKDPKNQYRIWGVPKNHVIFHPQWPIYIDARFCGNKLRYLRRSCNPNVEIATIVTSSTSKSSEVIKFVIIAKRDIEPGEELHISWHWDLRHPIWNLINDTCTIDDLTDMDKYSLIHSVDNILSACPCACGESNKDCHLYKVKRYSTSLYKSVKSKVKMNNRFRLNEILNQYPGRKRRQLPILERLIKKSRASEELGATLIKEINDREQIRLLLNADQRDHKVYTKTAALPKAMSSYSLNIMAKRIPSLLASMNKTNSLGNDYDNKISFKVLLDSDESDVTNVQHLPIPVELNTEYIYTKSNDFTVRNGSLFQGNVTGSDSVTSHFDAVGISSVTSESVKSPILSRKNSSITSLPIKRLHSDHIESNAIPSPLSTDRHNSTSINTNLASSLIETSTDGLQPLKKKLSFADYRKLHK